MGTPAPRAPAPSAVPEPANALATTMGVAAAGGAGPAPVLRARAARRCARPWRRAGRRRATQRRRRSRAAGRSGRRRRRPTTRHRSSRPKLREVILKQPSRRAAHDFKKIVADRSHEAPTSSPNADPDHAPPLDRARGDEVRDGHGNSTGRSGRASARWQPRRARGAGARGPGRRLWPLPAHALAPAGRGGRDAGDPDQDHHSPRLVPRGERLPHVVLPHRLQSPAHGPREPRRAAPRQLQKLSARSSPSRAPRASPAPSRARTTTSSRERSSSGARWGCCSASIGRIG